MSAGAVPAKLPTASDPYDDFPTTLSPHEIARFLDNHPHLNLTKLWNALGISNKEFNGMELNENPPYQFFPIVCDNCETQKFEYDLDGEPGTEVLLRLGERITSGCRYLVFKYAAGKWKLLGHVDAAGKYRNPQHTILTSQGITWLDIQEQGATGSGVASYVNSVYLVTPNQIIRAFGYISEGHQHGGPGSDNRSFNGQIVDCSLRDNIVNVRARYSVTYEGDQSVLFTKTHMVAFHARLGSGSYRFDRVHSDISEAEFDAVYDIDTLSDEEFLKYNYAALARIARGTDVKQIEWLRNFLPTCENTVERRRLSQLLTQ